MEKKINDIVNSLDNNLLIKHEKPIIKRDISKPIIYNDKLTQYANYENIILIDDSVNEYKKFYESVNDKTYSIIYSKNSNISELETLLNNFRNINRLCFIFDESNLRNKFFIENSTFFDINNMDNMDNIIKTSITKMIIDLINRLSIKNIDFLACNALCNNDWVKYFDFLKQYGVIVGASSDKTGNIKYGGDWIMETTNEDVKNIYFNDKIGNYSSRLAITNISIASGTINISQVSGNTYYNIDGGSDILISDWPVSITNTNPSDTNTVLVSINTNITIDSIMGSNAYFICNSNYICFDGNNKYIYINDVTSYNGLIQNGVGFPPTISNVYSNIIIQNIKLTSDNTSDINTSYPYAAWICQSCFGYNSTYLDEPTCGVYSCIVTTLNTNTYTGIVGENSTVLTNSCSTSGPINYGGIYFNQCYKCIAYYCTSSGDIEDYSGGIFGLNCYLCTANTCSSSGIIKNLAGGIYGYNNNQCIANSCNSSGIIKNLAGGIFSAYCIMCVADTCYSTGDINIYAGGIYGSSADQCTATTCYNTGNISSYAGGIIGSNCNMCIANTCYSTGIISDYAGGIYGINTTNCSAIKCNSSGSIGIAAGGIFAGGATYLCIADTCYSNGDINSSGGGIYGGGANNECSAINSYSTGDIGTDAGGIFGQYTNNQCLASNCYSLGTLGTSAGGIFGSNADSCSVIHCYTIGANNNSISRVFFGDYGNYNIVNNSSYTLNQIWNDIIANAYTNNNNGLLMQISGNDIWIDQSINTNMPFLLAAFDQGQGVPATVINTVINYPINLDIILPPPITGLIPIVRLVSIFPPTNNYTFTNTTLRINITGTYTIKYFIGYADPTKMTRATNYIQYLSYGVYTINARINGLPIRYISDGHKYKHRKCH